jgi:hypothetical protein
LTIPKHDNISWKTNKNWLQERIDRGDNFLISTNPRTLPDADNYIPGVPNGVFTARELRYLKRRGISVPYIKPKK